MLTFFHLRVGLLNIVQGESSAERLLESTVFKLGEDCFASGSPMIVACLDEFGESPAANCGLLADEWRDIDGVRSAEQSINVDATPLGEAANFGVEILACRDGIEEHIHAAPVGQAFDIAMPRLHGAVPRIILGMGDDEMIVV